MTNWSKIQKEWETTTISFKDLAEKHGVKIGTLKSRRSREKWNREKDASATPKKDATLKGKKDATAKKKKPHKRRSGNPNPQNQFTKRNRVPEIHGLFSKYLPEESLDIIQDMNESSAADLIWDQIQIQYAAIIRAQRIMHVRDADDHLQIQSGHSSSESGGSVSYKVAYAHERYNSFLSAQSRAMAEFRNLIKHFSDAAHEDDERLLRLRQMSVGIDKTIKETEFVEARAKLLKGSKKDTALLEALIGVVESND